MAQAINRLSTHNVLAQKRSQPSKKVQKLSSQYSIVLRDKSSRSYGQMTWTVSSIESVNQLVIVSPGIILGSEKSRNTFQTR